MTEFMLGSPHRVDTQVDSLRRFITVRELSELPLDASGITVVDAACPKCDVRGGIDVTTFRSWGERHLRWHCPQCTNTWVERASRGPR